MAKIFFFVRNSRITNKDTLNKLFDPEGIGSVSLKDGKYSLEVLPEGRRNLPQNNLLHFWLPYVTKALQALGWDEILNDADTKRYLKAKFLTRYYTNHETGETIPYIKDTHELTEAEMRVFLNNIDMFCARDLETTLPKRNKNNYDGYDYSNTNLHIFKDD